MEKWLRNLNYNPVTSLLKCNNEAILAFVKRDLFDEAVSIENLWRLAEPQKILKRQKSDGSWTYSGGKSHIRTQENYNQLETYRNLGYLVEMFGFNKQSPAISKAADFLFSFQVDEGDIRGILGNQYTPYYTAGMLELLIKAGYQNNPRVEKAFKWLAQIRQNDGGWAIPLRTRGEKLDIIATHKKTLEPDRSKPFSWLVTGVVLRAYAAHPLYRKSNVAQKAGKLILSHLFKRDNYPDRAGAEYWLRFSFPFWFADLISALDSLSLLGFSKEEPQINKALEWFIKNQQKSGLWELKILKGQNKDILKLWLSLAVCRIFKRLYN